MRIKLNGFLIGCALLMVSCSSDYKMFNGDSDGDSLAGSDEQFLRVVPSPMLFEPIGDFGGPFYPSSKSVTISNTKNRPSDWRLTIQQPWLSASKISGTLSAYKTEELVFSINEAANTLTAGIYKNSIVFYENNRTYIRTVKLTIRGTVCGNNVTEYNEKCDGTDLNETCQTLGYSGGTLACLPDCSDYDTTNCDPPGANCGDGVIEAPELCDGNNLAGETCQSLGFSGGILGCRSDCSAFDTSACARCGNNITELDEECDGSDLAGETCQTLGFNGGTLGCMLDCNNFDTTRCTSIPPSCTPSTTSFQNFSFVQERGVFKAKFSATPSALGMSGVIGLSDVAGSSFAEFPVLVGFNPSGKILARNGGAFTADSEVVYEAGVTYGFEVEVNANSHTYDVRVSLPGGAVQLLADDYAFRTERADTSVFANYGVIADVGSMLVCDFTTQTISNFTVSAGADTSIIPGGSAKLLGSASGGQTPYRISWSPTAGLDNPSALQPTARPQQTTTYTISVTDSSAVPVTLQDSVTVQVRIPNAVTPIGRWDIVPYQRIETGKPLNLGIVAFSKNGIAKVTYRIESAAYTGPNPLETTEMRLNPQTNVVEYWVTLDASAFNAGTVAMVKAEIIGADGGIRNWQTQPGYGLDPFTVVVNKGGNPAVEAWVNPSAVDSNGVIGDPLQPFKTVGMAINKIREKRNQLGLGNNADGGIVHLTPGTHAMSNGTIGDVIAVNNEWVTITTASGGMRSNTTFQGGDSVILARKVHLKGLTIPNPGPLSFGYADRGMTEIWIDDCSLIGAGREYAWAHPLAPDNWKAAYLTDSSITDVHMASVGYEALARGLTITKISDDSFQNVPMIVNSTVDDIYPMLNAHADLVQYFNASAGNRIADNAIVYGLRGTNLNYQNFNIGNNPDLAPDKAKGVAWVNVYSDGPLIRPDGQAGWAGWYLWVDHLIWWNMTLRTKGLSLSQQFCYGNGSICPVHVSNFSARGNDFEFFKVAGDEAYIDYSDFNQNHFVEVSDSNLRGTNYTTGPDYLDSYGVPQLGSPLLDRLIPPVFSFDLRNRSRGDRGDIGAYER